METQHSLSALQKVLNEQIIGQKTLVDRLLIALLADGHLLVEGAPGLAKTTAIKHLAQNIEAKFHRIQFTPDLLPADLTGTEIYRPQTASFHFQPGPLFHNLILADEINRAPAKVQSALLEAMGEKQITVGKQTYALPRLFLVMATQNPIEQEGTYPLPEAQLDRFLMHVNVGYPDKEAERKILHLVRAREQFELQHPGASTNSSHLVSEAQIFAARQEVLNLHMSPALDEYIIELVSMSRNPSRYSAKLASWLQYGASPRATLALDRCARAHAWLAGRDFVSPEDIQQVAFDVLRHRLILSFEAQAEEVSTDQCIQEILALVAVP